MKNGSTKDLSKIIPPKYCPIPKVEVQAKLRNAIEVALSSLVKNFIIKASHIGLTIFMRI